VSGSANIQNGGFSLTENSKTKNKLLLDELLRGLKTIKNQKKKAKSLEIDTYRITSDEDLEDILNILKDKKENKEIDPKELKKDIRLRVEEIRLATKTDMAAVRTMRKILRMI